MIKKINKQFILHASSLLLTAAGLGWIVFLLFNNVVEHGLQQFIPEYPCWLLVASFLLILSLSLNAVNFYQFLVAASQEPVSFILSMRLHTMGQIVRYLPGRFWGLIYQINFAHKVLPATGITRANVDLMLLTLIGNLLVSIVILGINGYISAWLVYIISLIGILSLLATFLGGLSYFFNLCIKLLPVPFTKMRNFFTFLALSHLTLTTLLQIALVFIFSWGIYLAAWYTLGQGFILLDPELMLILCVWYTLAWIIGFIAAFTPNGLGVREVSFVLMAGHSFDDGTLAFLAIFVRVWLMLADILNGLFWTLLHAKTTKKDNTTNTSAI